jgi:hypothetical protein
MIKNVVAWRHKFLAKLKKKLPIEGPGSGIKLEIVTKMEVPEMSWEQLEAVECNLIWRIREERHEEELK